MENDYILTRSFNDFRAPHRRLAFGLFVVHLHQAVEEPHPPTRAPARIDIAARGIEGGARDVKVHPGRVLDEALDELGAGDRSAEAAADILHVGVLAVDQLVVGLGERHAPDLLTAELTRARQLA